MKIFVKAKPGAKENKVVAPTPKLWLEEGTQSRERTGEKTIEKEWFKVSVKEPALQGRANTAIAKALAEYFGVAPSQVALVSGATSKQKVFDILKI